MNIKSRIVGMTACSLLMTGACFALSLPQEADKVFPLNMGFKTFQSVTPNTSITPAPIWPQVGWDTSTANNEDFDSRSATPDSKGNYYTGNLTTAIHFPIHHGGVNDMKKIKAVYPSAITIATIGPKGVYTGSNETVPAGQTRPWPGHLLYFVGTNTTEIIPYASANATTTIHVVNAGVFANTYKNDAGVDVSDTDDHVIIYERNPTDNQPNWATSEYAQVSMYDLGNSTVTVKRGRRGTSARAFPSGAYIAPHVASWEEQGATAKQNFRPNFSLHCPRKPDTQEQANQYFAKLAAAALNDSGQDGTEADEAFNSFNNGNRGIDADNDGVADWGYFGGANSYGLGLQQYAKNLRTLAKDKIIQFDSDFPNSGYRGWNYVNGVQMETFMDTKLAPGTRFSEAYEHLSHWVKSANPLSTPITQNFSYGYCRYPTTLYHSSATAANATGNNAFRRNFAVGLMLGMPHPYGSGTDMGLFDWDEQRGGTLNNYRWLGKALGAAKREPCTKPDGSTAVTDFLAGAQWQVTVDAGYAAQNTGSNGTTGTPFPSGNSTPFIPDATNSINITAVPFSNTHNDPLVNKPKPYGVRLELAKLSSIARLVVGTEYTLIFNAKATDTQSCADVNGITQTYPKTPFQISIGNFGGYKATVLADNVWRSYNLSFVAGNTPATFTFGVSETKGTVQFSGIKFYEGTTNRLSREFENGKVFLNMSKSPWVIPNNGTSLLLPAGTVYQYLSGNQTTNPQNAGGGIGGNLTVQAYDAVFLKK